MKVRGSAGLPADEDDEDAAASAAAALHAVSALRAGYGAIEVLRGVDLAVGAGEIVALLGSNGAGKSTLNHNASGLYRPRGGSIRFDGNEITGASSMDIVEAGLVQALAAPSGQAEGRMQWGRGSELRSGISQTSLAGWRRCRRFRPSVPAGLPSHQAKRMPMFPPTSCLRILFWPGQYLHMPEACHTILSLSLLPTPFHPPEMPAEPADPCQARHGGPDHGCGK